MINKIINSVLLGNRIQSVHIHLGTDQKEYRLIEIHKSKNNLSITDEFATTHFEELITKISKNKPVVVSITGQGIISKKVDNNPNYQSKILFNADPDDFYWYECKQETTLYVSVARKELIDAEIVLLEKSQVSVIGISIGPFVSTGIKQLLEDTVIQTHDFDLTFKNDVLVEFKKRSEKHTQEYTIGDEVISGNNIIGFASVLHHLYPNDTIASEIAYLSKNKEEYTYKKAFNVLGVFTLSFFLISLLISYLLLDHYQNAHHKVQVELGQQNVAYSKLVSLEKDKENKEAILKESGLRDSNYLSFYISEITREVPSEINLKLLNVFPATSKIKAEQRINFTNDLVEIEGTVSSYTAFASWMKVLKKQPWVGNLEIVDFQKENKTNSFKIKLLIKFNV